MGIRVRAKIPPTPQTFPRWSPFNCLKYVDVLLVFLQIQLSTQLFIKNTGFPAPGPSKIDSPRRDLSGDGFWRSSGAGEPKQHQKNAQKPSKKVKKHICSSVSYICTFFRILLIYYFICFNTLFVYLFLLLCV